MIKKIINDFFTESMDLKNDILMKDKNRSYETGKNEKKKLYETDPEAEQKSISIDINYTGSSKSSANPVLTQKRLQEAIIWSEILGEPKCKRRKRR